MKRGRVLENVTQLRGVLRPVPSVRQEPVCANQNIPIFKNQIVPPNISSINMPQCPLVCRCVERFSNSTQRQTQTETDRQRHRDTHSDTRKPIFIYEVSI